MWIATESGSGEIGENGGLWRFDGKTFSHFTTKDGLPHNGVFGLVEDVSGNIWIGTRNTAFAATTERASRLFRNKTTGGLR